MIFIPLSQQLIKSIFMKKIFPLFLAIIFFNYGCGSMFLASEGYNSVEQVQVGATEQTYQTFYNGLAPYGNWITDPQYGYVWMPRVHEDFEPYSTNGHWAYTNVGWTWVSNYNWGWATFHYGRWFFQNGRGWLWIPGHEWGPAWVIWGDVDDYYGWAPMGPGSRIGDGWQPPSNYWNFVPRQYMYERNLDRYKMDRNNRLMYSNRVNINFNRQLNPYENPNHNYRDHDNGRSFINIGPKFDDVRQHINTNIRPLRINDNKMPDRSSENRHDLFIYKPPIMHEDAQKEQRNRPAPIQNKPLPPRPPRQPRDEKRDQ
jgi:hypothetical protein